MSHNAIQVAQVTKTYRDLAMHSLTLDVEAGSIMGLIGPNGAGKTTHPGWDAES